MRRAPWIISAALVLSLCTGFAAGDSGLAEDFRVRYRLHMTREDYVQVETCVSGYSGDTLVFSPTQ